jgi:hypothetical protein
MENKKYFIENEFFYCAKRVMRTASGLASMMISFKSFAYAMQIENASHGFVYNL